MVVRGPDSAEQTAIDRTEAADWRRLRAILRTMKGRRPRFPRALIVDRFEAEGATLDDVKRRASQSQIAVLTLAEIRAEMAAINRSSTKE